MSSLSRRDFLRILPALAAALALHGASRKSTLSRAVARDGPLPNVIIFVFDAMSAKNLSLYGYRRHTTPNLERFAETATVYNAHYSPGNFTTPGTASLLTGLYPWTHRAINYSGLVTRNRAHQNLFKAIGSRHQRLAYSQNIWANYLFAQFDREIDAVLPPGSFSLIQEILGDRAGGDLATNLRAFDDFLFQYNANLPGSLVFGLNERIFFRRAQIIAENREADAYPRGLPQAGDYADFFVLKDIFDGLMGTIGGLDQPSFAYLHLWAPHEPFRPTREFDGLFADGWAPPKKPAHILGEHNSRRTENGRRQSYDEYIANVDAEFGRLLEFLNKNGLMEQSYVIVTSDHGQLFERGVIGHATPLLYEAVTRVPLVVSSPGQASRQDVYSPTSSVDLLPTILRLIGSQAADWQEGQLLPRLGGEETWDRAIFMMDAKENPAFSALSHASFAMRKGPHKLIYYKGFPQYDRADQFELYDLENDPEELNNLYDVNSATARAMQSELLATVESVNSKNEH
jgi:arylsulfatase A-like enzyme